MLATAMFQKSTTQIVQRQQMSTLTIEAFCCYIEYSKEKKTKSKCCCTGNITAMTIRTHDCGNYII